MERYIDINDFDYPLPDERIAKLVVEYKEGLAKKIAKANEELAQIKYEYKTN